MQADLKEKHLAAGNIKLCTVLCRAGRKGWNLTQRHVHRLPLLHFAIKMDFSSVPKIFWYEKLKIGKRGEISFRDRCTDSICYSCSHGKLCCYEKLNILHSYWEKYEIQMGTKHFAKQLPRRITGKHSRVFFGKNLRCGKSVQATWQPESR